MSTEALAAAFATARGVLSNVTADQLDETTPCASWNVRRLVNHLVGNSVATTSSNALIKQPKLAASSASSNDSDTKSTSRQPPEHQSTSSGYARAGLPPHTRAP